VRLGLVTVVVRDYDEAIDFYVRRVGFTLTADHDMGGGKRWVVVSPEVGAGLLLARADGPRQHRRIGHQTGGRVSLFLYTADFDGTYARMSANGVEFLEPPRAEPYGQVCVWRDLYGNKWDLLEESSPG
jgi:catechol 2,3-dioxygenase-like lactoylglutathione lyase family enzyme